MNYRVQIFLLHREWGTPKTKWSHDWDITMPFYSVNDARQGIQEWREKSGADQPHFLFRIIDDNGCVMWPEQVQPAEKRGDTPSMEIQLEKPLVLVRKDVIAKLQENFDKEKKTREDAAKKEADARDDFRQFILDHEEQIVNYVAACLGGGGWKTKLDSAEQIFEKDGQYKTPESKAGRLESELEKFVRVLKMGAEDTIEVKPTQAVYDLL